jgi:hypothetical protein
MEPKGLPMTRETVTRAGNAVLIYSMASSVLFGAGLILVLSLPALSADIGFWISVVVGASFILAAPSRGGWPLDCVPVTGGRG